VQERHVLVCGDSLEILGNCQGTGLTRGVQGVTFSPYNFFTDLDKMLVGFFSQGDEILLLHILMLSIWENNNLVIFMTAS
jgi:hypothetical protein